MSTFAVYRDKLTELHKLTKLECRGHAAVIRDSDANDVRWAMERLWSDLSASEQTIAREIACRLGCAGNSLCMVVFACNEGDVIKLHVLDDDKFDDYLVGEAGTSYHVFELIGYDYFIQQGVYPLSQFKDHPRVREYLKKR